MIFFVAVLLIASCIAGGLQSYLITTSNADVELQEKGKRVPPFSFTASSGGFFSNNELADKWTLFFIGYTFCPDICPTTLADLDRIYPKLVEAQGSQTQIVFISVDPNRDKAAHLADYIHYFNPNFIALSSTHEQLIPFTQALGLVYSIVDEGYEGPFYLIDHSASLVLINPNGEHHATFKAGVNEQGIAHVDMDAMVDHIHRFQQQW